ncbi:MAG: T9SS type A sorting domain-containing protein [bacterium]|nr:T9SS type A sorting domain-containing protein [bacterium]
MSLSQYTQAIADANDAYANSGIVFYSLGVDYIDNDSYFTGVTGGEYTTLRQQNVVSAAINVYFAPVTPGLCGLSSFTFSSVQGIIQNNACSGVPNNPSTFPHEIGHYFDLFHTHETAFGSELVNGSNCSTAGDLLCDTPADPRLGTSTVTSNCVYTGTATDTNSDLYVPDPRQYMSYSRKLCRDVFSPLSETRAVQTLLALRPELLSRGCSPFGNATVVQLDPPSGFVDQTLDVILQGTNLGMFTTTTLGAGITVNAVDTLSSDSLIVNITIASNALLGPRDVIVNNAFTPDTLAMGFLVTPTLRHYVSAGGGDVYPYALPEQAALTLADVFTATASGDTVYVDTTTLVGVSTGTSDGLYISGGWTDDFTTRDLNTARTVIELSNNIQFFSPDPIVFDGFHLRNGTGTALIQPESGNYGGGILILTGSTVTISNCIIERCTGAPSASFSGGGGIFALNSTVTIIDNQITKCEATVGGAVYLYGCSGSVSGNVITKNSAVIGGTGTLVGAGIAMDECAGIAASNNTLDGNTDASSGGSYWIRNSTGITIDGGSITNSSASFGGGGAYVGGSDVTLTSVRFESNAAGILGGALQADSSTIAATECEVVGNTALIGGGLYILAGTATIRHNLVAGNTASNTAGGLFVSGIAAGEIVGNTIDSNTGGSGVGGLSIAGSAIAVVNNIISNTIGDGLGCSGTPPLNAYNLVWNSTGVDYNGCSAGAGALNADPMFSDIGSEDYHLTLNSPAIDSGDPNPSLDDPDGSRGDMGRYGSHAFTMDQPSYPQNLVSDVGDGDVVLSWAPNPESDIDFYAVYCDTTSGFVPGPGNLVTTTTDTTSNLGAPTDTVYYRVSAVDLDGYAGGYSDEASSEPTVPTAIGDVVLYTTSLWQNAPNPFNPETVIRFTLSERQAVQIIVYDVTGRRVRTLLTETRPAGLHDATWDARSDAGTKVASGVYFYRLRAGKFSETRKMLLLK